MEVVPCSARHFPLNTDEVACSHWRTAALIVCACWISILSVFGPAVSTMVTTWYHSNTFAHGFLVLPISLYLIWTRRQSLMPLIPVPTLWGLLLLVGLGCGWLLGNLADVLVVQQLMVVAMLPGGVWLVLGTRVARILLFPLLFLFFAVPIGLEFEPVLQDFTAAFTVRALRLSGITVFRDGWLLALPTGIWHVAETCSGSRYLYAAVMLGCLYAWIIYRRWTRRLGFLLASVVVPIVANGVRAYGLVLLGYLSDHTIAAGVDHVLYGWLFFGLVMFLLLGVGCRWREPSHETVSTLAPVQTHGRPCSAQQLGLTAACGVSLLAVAPLVAQVMAHRSASPLLVQAVAPQVRPPWQPLAEVPEAWTPHFVGAHAHIFQSYTSGRRPVSLYIAYYASQQQGTELINSENNLRDGKTWVRIAESRTQAVVDDHRLQVHMTRLRSAQGGTRLVWSWYWVAGAFTSHPYHAKVLHVKARLFGGPQGAAVIALGTQDNGDQAEAAAVLQDFLRHSVSLQATLQSFSR